MTAVLPLDDLLVVSQEFINPDLSRLGLDRCLRLHDMGSLRELQTAAQEETKVPPKSFRKSIAPGKLMIYAVKS